MIFPGLAASAGTVLGVSTHPNGTSVWALCDDGTDATLGAAALASWQDVQVALTRSLPVLWESVNDHVTPPGLRFLHIWTSRGFSQRVSLVDGPSFGLSFALLLTSRLSGIPVSPVYAAMAAVEPSGRIMRIGGLSEKIEAIVEAACGVTTLVVAADQEKEAADICRGRFRLLAVRNVAEACHEIFGERLVEKLLQLGEDPGERGRIVSSLFRIALKGRSELVDWTPIERAADIALTKWLSVPDDKRWTLEFVRGVAARHQRNGGVIPVPSCRPITWPRALWLEVLAHLLQQAADSGDPAPKRVMPLAEKELTTDVREALGQELRVAGALGRLEAVTGAPERALRRQSSIAQIQWDTYAWHEISRPLAEWLRLAAATADSKEFATAERMFREAEAHRAIDAHGQAYLRLSWARAVIMLLTDRGQDVPATLERLASDATVPDHVRWSAIRWLHRYHLQQGQPARARDWLRALEGPPDAQVPLLLARLDEAAMTRRDPPHGIVERLQELQPGVVGHLLKVAPAGREMDYLIRFFPY